MRKDCHGFQFRQEPAMHDTYYNVCSSLISFPQWSRCLNTSRLSLINKLSPYSSVSPRCLSFRNAFCLFNGSLVPVLSHWYSAVPKPEPDSTGSSAIVIAGVRTWLRQTRSWYGAEFADSEWVELLAGNIVVSRHRLERRVVFATFDVRNCIVVLAICALSSWCWMCGVFVAFDIRISSWIWPTHGVSFYGEHMQ